MKKSEMSCDQLHLEMGRILVLGHGILASVTYLLGHFFIPFKTSFIELRPTVLHAPLV